METGLGAKAEAENLGVRFGSWELGAGGLTTKTLKHKKIFVVISCFSG